MKASNIIGGLILFGAAGFGIKYLLKTSNTGKKTSVSITGVNPPKLQGGSIVLGVDIAMDNPTNNSISLKKPYLTVFYNGSEVGNSIPSEERTPIKANDRTVIKGINIQIPFIKLGALAIQLLTGKIPKMAIDILMRTEANGIPYTDKQHYDL